MVTLIHRDGYTLKPYVKNDTKFSPIYWHEENIMDVFKKKPPCPKKTPKYRSKFHKIIKPTEIQLRTCGFKHRTMGRQKECRPHPLGFMRKGEGRPPYTYCRKREYMRNAIGKGESNIPERKEIERFNKQLEEREVQRATRNFVEENKQKLKQLYKEPVHRTVITCTGETHTSSGMEPIFRNREEFGKVPPYLKRFQKHFQRMRELKRGLAALDLPKCRYMVKEEREKLLHDLKENWGEMQREYQLLPMVTDTIPKRMRKLGLENALKAIERDITRIESHPYLYVYQDEEDAKKNETF